MAAGKYSFTIEQGATTDFEIAYKDSANSPIDLTDYTARMQLKPTAGSDITYLTLSSSLGTCGTGLNMGGSSGANPPTSGTIGVFISAHSSSLLTFDNAFYDLEISSGSGVCSVVTRLIEGKVKLVQEITTGTY
jgi:hypothetical protein